MRVAQRSAIILAAAISGLALTAAAAAAPAFSVRGMAVATASCLKVKATIPVGSGPDGIAVDPVTNTIYVTNQSGNSVSVINGGTDAVSGSLQLSVNGIAVNASTGTIYTAADDAGPQSDVVSALTSTCP